MPLFQPTPPTDADLRATGDKSFATPSSVRFESDTGSSYALAQQGIATESGVALPVYEAGASFQTAQGDYVAVQDTRVNDDGSVETYQYTAYDAGVSQLVIVGDEQPTTAQPTAESDASFNPLTDTATSAPVAFAQPLLAEQTDPQGGDISIGTSFSEDPAQVVDGLASAVAVINTGDTEEQAS